MADEQQSTDGLITSPVVGQILGKSAATVQRMARAGQLPVEYKLPGSHGTFLFRRSEIERFALSADAAAAASS